MDAIEVLSRIQCECERADALESMTPSRDEMLALLAAYGFGGPNSAVPSDWRTYCTDEELRGEILALAA